MDKINYLATAAFGLEAVVKRELMRLRALDSEIDDIRVSDGRVDFIGGLNTVASSNLWLRSADRVLIVIGEFEARTFDELFEGTKALPWGDWLNQDAKFIVTGKSVRSELFSVSDCQAIVKKAIVEKLKLKYNVSWFEETGPEYKIQVGLLRNLATLTIDTTGSDGLHKRGYRRNHTEAPIKETLAAGLIDLSYWRDNRVFLDPMCGSGTMPIEAAMFAANIAPGHNRTFVSESWPQIEDKHWKTARVQASDVIKADFKSEIYGSDISAESIELAKSNADKAGVGAMIRFEQASITERTLPGNNGVMICNPPYGERLSTPAEVSKLYKELGILASDKSWSYYVITPDEEFEKSFGRKADSKRKLYNGMIKTDYYQFHGPKPRRG